jgi:hypothetical protein
MSLPQILNPNPLTIPAGEEKTFSNAYIVGLQLITLDASGFKQRLQMTFRPYNQGTNELARDQSHDFFLSVNDIWSEAGRVPILAHVMGSIATAANLLVQERDLLDKLSKAGGAEKTALEQQLASVRAEMGIQ